MFFHPTKQGLNKAEMETVMSKYLYSHGYHFASIKYSSSGVFSPLFPEEPWLLYTQRVREEGEEVATAHCKLQAQISLREIYQNTSQHRIFAIRCQVMMPRVWTCSEDRAGDQISMHGCLVIFFDRPTSSPPLSSSMTSRICKQPDRMQIINRFLKKDANY
jgi:hypothetical protein